MHAPKVCNVIESYVTHSRKMKCFFFQIYSMHEMSNQNVIQTKIACLQVTLTLPINVYIIIEFNTKCHRILVFTYRGCYGSNTQLCLSVLSMQ